MYSLFKYVYTMYTLLMDSILQYVTNNDINIIDCNIDFIYLFIFWKYNDVDKNPMTTKKFV